MSVLGNLLSVERAPLFTMLDHCQRLDVQKADRHTARWSVHQETLYQISISRCGGEAGQTDLRGRSPSATATATNWHRTKSPLSGHHRGDRLSASQLGHLFLIFVDAGYRYF